MSRGFFWGLTHRFGNIVVDKSPFLVAAMIFIGVMISNKGYHGGYQLIMGGIGVHKVLTYSCLLMIKLT